MTTMSTVCADIDDLHRQIVALTAENARLRSELETANNELHTARVTANRTGR